MTFYIGVVDGNGANSGSGVTDSDPLGDDVAMGVIRLEERDASTGPAEG